MSDIRTSELTIEPGFKVLIPEAKDLYEFATKVNNDPNAVDLYELERNRRGDPPSMEAKIAGMDYNRTTNTKGSGPYQMLVRAERMALRDGLSRFYNSIPTKNHYTLNELLEMVDYIPNARLGYLNKLIKRALEGLASNRFLITSADLDFVKTIWINQRSKEVLLRLLSDNLNPKAEGYSIDPVQSRSGVRFRDAPGINTGQYIALRNPGNVYFPQNSNLGGFEDDRVGSALVGLIKKIDERIQKANDDLQITLEHQSLLNFADNPNNAVTRSLVAFMDKISDKHITLKELTQISETINSIIGLRKSKYFMSLAQPWKHRTARIPTLISPPSATFSLRSMVTLTTNASGNVAFGFSPFYLADAATANSTFAINNNAALTGTGPSNFFVATAVGQQLPANFYIKYRVVSAALKLYCFPSSNNDNGIATISVSFITGTSVAVPGTNAAYQQFGDFNLIENGYWKTTTTVASREVQEHVYVPLDDSFLDYVNISGHKQGFNWVGYISGAAPSSSIARVEVVTNYEALLDNAYTDYLPSDTVSDEIDPKMVPHFVNEVKKQEKLNPQTLNDVLKEVNQGFSDDDVIELPTPPRVIKEKEKAVKDNLSLASDLVKDFLPAVPKSKQSNIFGEIMDAISPIANAVIQQAASRILPMPFKF